MTCSHGFFDNLITSIPFTPMTNKELCFFLIVNDEKETLIYLHMFEFLRIMNIWNLKTKYLWGLTGISQTLQLCIKFHYMHIYTANLWTRMVSTPLSETKNPVILSFSSLRPNTLQFTHLSLLLKKWLIHYLLRSSKWKKKCYDLTAVEI